MTVVTGSGELVATFLISFIQYLTHQGGLRSQIEAVRVSSTHLAQGLGTEILHYAIQRAKDRGAHVLQLTTDKNRPRAKRFYQSRGFVDAHEGMKLHFDR